MTKNDIQEIFLEEVDKAINAGLPIPTNLDTHIQFNKRKTALGVCTKNRRSSLCKIALSIYMLDMPERMIRETIAHELCHTCSNDSHGKQWKFYANILNNKYGYHISRLANREDTKKFNEISGYKRNKDKYAIECPNCNRRWYYARMCWTIKCTEDGECKCPYCKVAVKRIK